MMRSGDGSKKPPSFIEDEPGWEERFLRARAQHPAEAARNNGTKVEGTAGEQGTGRRLPGFGRCRVSCGPTVGTDGTSMRA